MSLSFRIHILKCRWHELGSPYTGIWERLQRFPLKKAWLVIKAEQIESFDPKSCGFVLCPQVSRRMEKRFGEWLWDLTMLKTAFVVSLGRQKLFGGLFVEEGSAAAIGFPVFHTRRVGDQWTLDLRPDQFVSWQWMKDCRHAEIPGLKLVTEYFRSQGKLIKQKRRRGACTAKRGTLKHW